MLKVWTTVCMFPKLHVNYRDTGIDIFVLTVRNQLQINNFVGVVNLFAI